MSFIVCQSLYEGIMKTKTKLKIPDSFNLVNLSSPSQTQKMIPQIIAK